MRDQRFADLCAEQPDLFFEMTAAGDLIVMLPRFSSQSFWHLCPDFVIELRSKTDRIPALRAKMREWLENGAQAAWLIDPERRAVEIFRPGREPETLLDPQSVSGEGPVAGFTLSLPRVWDPLA